MPKGGLGGKKKQEGQGHRRMQEGQGERVDIVNLQGILTENALLKELEIRYTEQQYWVSNITTLTTRI